MQVLRQRRFDDRTRVTRMHSGVYLVVILLTLGYAVNVSDSLSSSALQRETKSLSTLSSSSSASRTRDDFSRNLKRAVSTKIHRPAVTTANATRSKMPVTISTVKSSPKRKKNVAVVVSKTNKLALIHDLRIKTKNNLGKRDKRRKHKRRRRRVLMALLLAYKLKFAALIPAMIGGLILLVSTTALAGFFFALFAAVLGLKNH